MNSYPRFGAAIIAAALLVSCAAAGLAQPVGTPAAGAHVPLVLLRRSTKKPPDGSRADVLVGADVRTDRVAAEVARLMADPARFGQFVLRLDAAAKRYLLRDPKTPAAARGALAQPAYLFLSDREGGFPAESFWLEQADGSLVEKRNVAFVDLVVEAGDLEPGRIDNVEAIYAHELGHLVMAALAGPAPARASNAAHFVTVRTDGWTAFVEGWGEHYQPLAVDHARRAATIRWPAADPPSAVETFWRERFAGEQVRGCWICPANLRFLRWHGRGEQRLRDQPLRDNLFVHAPVLPAPLRSDARPAREVRMYRDVVPPSPDNPLKNGPQMLASEGVLATLFHRISTDERLRNTYREASFYAPFLAEGLVPAGADPRSLVPPAENVYFKIFDALHHGFEWGSWPAIEFVAAYARRSPDDASALYDVFLEVTRGVTVEKDALARQGDPRYLAGLRDRLLAGTARLDGHLGPPLWIVAPGTTFGMGLFRYFPMPSSFTFDLNAADEADLRAMPGVSAEIARAIVDERDRRGWFATAGDVARVPGVTLELAALFARQAERMEERLRRPRPRQQDPGWVRNYLALALRRSYDAAAVWQFGRALFLAALGFLSVKAVARKLAPAAGPRPAAVEAPVPPRRRRTRRAVVALAKGMAAAAVPCAASIALYRAGYFPTALNMAVTGLVLGVCAWPLAKRSPGLVLAWIVASAIVGFMY